MKLRIKTTFKYSGDAKLSLLAFRVSGSLTNNPNFPDPVPAQADFEKALQEFRKAASEAGRFDRTKTSVKNDKKVVLINMLSELAAYIEATSQGDRTKLLSSGFDITGIKRESNELSSIHDFKVVAETPGQATTRVNRVIGARAYVHQYTPDPITADSVWVSETVAERQHTFEYLQSVRKYWFRVIAIGRGKQSLQSPPVARVIQ